MKKKDFLQKQLNRIDGKGYKAYKDIKGQYYFRDFVLFIDHVQGDPFAAPSKMRVRVPAEIAGFPNDTYSTHSRNTGLCDYLTRCFHRACSKFTKGKRGSGKGGKIGIDRPTQQILERTSVIVTGEYVEARFVLGLPAFGRKIAGRQAEEMLCQELPEIVNHSMKFASLDQSRLYKHIETTEDADYLRGRLEENNLIAFIADGSILPRASGIDPRPMDRAKAIPFQSPESMRVEFTLPNRGSIEGMGVPKGVTLIIGGGYHGKSTVLDAIELGIYNHIPDDGREFVITDPAAVKIRAEDGRRIEKVSISPFIKNLPLGEDTCSFCSDNASGSTSQAANIIEAIELSASVLLIDEDTSATNFMIRDHRMQDLVAKENEPITPFIDKARQLYEQLGVSTVLVLGGSGDYFDIADTVVCMKEYRPLDYTGKARAVAEKFKAERKNEGGSSFGEIKERSPQGESINPRRGKKPVKIKTPDLTTISFGTEEIDLSSVEQLADTSQTRAIADAINYAKRYMSSGLTLSQVIAKVFEDIEKDGLDVLSKTPNGSYAIFRRFELAAAINRLRTLQVTQKE